MKKFSTLLAQATLVISAITCNAYADWNCDPSCCEPSGCPSLHVGADFLWWKPNIDDLDYAALASFTTTVVGGQTQNVTDLEYQNINPGWEPGVRGYVGLDNLLKGWGLYATYTYQSIGEINHLTAAAPDFILAPFDSGLLVSDTAPVGRYRSVSSKYNSDYNNWDILVSHKIGCSPCIEATAFLGVSALYLDQWWREQYLVPSGDLGLPDYAGNVLNSTWNSDYWGAGMKIGTSLNYRLTNCFSVIGLASASLITGRDDNVVNYSSLDVPLTTVLKVNDDNDHWQMVFGYHLQLGLRYATEFCGQTVGLRFGYEVLSWCNIPNQRNFQTLNGVAAVLSTSPSTTTYGFHGVFVGGDVHF